MRLRNKVCVITGAASGIGRTSSLLFAREGGRIVVADRDREGSERVAAQIEAAAGEALPCAMDVCSAADSQRMIAEAERAFGAVDVLFNNAGIFPEGDASPVETSEELWDEVMRVNLKGVFLGCKYGIPALKRSGGGSIINTASFVALMGAAAAQVAYTASKGGVLAFTREVAAIYARDHIRANALCPGPVETPLLRALIADPAARRRRLVHVPYGRFCQPDEVARAALFLASDDSSYVNGAAFTVDGGISTTYITPE
jgi:NAD(P)-dependent dehydrogenase (short-subunit alcohol dehydrogenase family)